jgi:hypothetical protein
MDKRTAISAQGEALRQFVPLIFWNCLFSGLPEKPQKGQKKIMDFNKKALTSRGIDRIIPVWNPTNQI